VARTAAGQRRAGGEQQIGRRWEAQAGEAFLDLREWRAVHPKATLAAIEAELDRRLEALRARMLADMALASRAADLQSEERAVCPTCGTGLHDGGLHQRTLVTMGNQKVELVRDYGTCPGCGGGLFPPGRGIGVVGPATLQPQGGGDAGATGAGDHLRQGGAAAQAADGGADE
jgi:hypothetical protein